MGFAFLIWYYFFDFLLFRRLGKVLRLLMSEMLLIALNPALKLIYLVAFLVETHLFYLLAYFVDLLVLGLFLASLSFF